jgi:hypothetical protein
MHQPNAWWLTSAVVAVMWWHTIHSIHMGPYRGAQSVHRKEREGVSTEHTTALRCSQLCAGGRCTHQRPHVLKARDGSTPNAQPPPCLLLTCVATATGFATVSTWHNREVAKAAGQLNANRGRCWRSSWGVVTSRVARALHFESASAAIR